MSVLGEVSESRGVADWGLRFLLVGIAAGWLLGPEPKEKPLKAEWVPCPEKFGIEVIALGTPRRVQLGLREDGVAVWRLRPAEVRKPYTDNLAWGLNLPLKELMGVEK